MEIEELRQLAKSKGIKHWHNKKRETLESDLLMPKEAVELLDKAVKKVFKPKIEVSITEQDNKFFESIGFKSEWLASLANQYNFTRFHYIPKFKAFRCYRGFKHVDWISVNDLGLVNEKKELTSILMKHQPLQKDKQIIKLPWR